MEREAREVRERTSIASKARAARAAKTARGRAAGSPRGAKARVARAAPDSRQQARTIAYSLARALRALSGGLSWERLGRIALLRNASEILPKSLPEASRDLPELTLALLGLLFALLGVMLGLLRALSGASGEPLGPSKTFQNRSRRLSRRPPAPELDFGSILGGMLAPFWDPPELKKRGFRVEGVAFFEKSKGFEKTT